MQARDEFFVKKNSSQAMRRLRRTGGSGWIREPRTEKQPTGLFFPGLPGRAVLFSSHPLMPLTKSPCRGAAKGVPAKVCAAKFRGEVRSSSASAR